MCKVHSLKIIDLCSLLEVLAIDNPYSLVLVYASCLYLYMEVHLLKWL